MAYLSTSADLISRTYRFLKEASASPEVFPSAQVVDYLDEAHAYVCAEFRYLQSQWFTTTSAAVGRYTFPADLLTVRHVLHRKDNATGTKLVMLEPGSITDFMYGDGDLEASGTASHWALVGVAGGPVLQIYPAPDTSAASGVMVIGNQTPESIGTSASPLSRALLPLVPIQAALLAWSEQGIKEEITRLSGMYDVRASMWKKRVVDMSPEVTEVDTFGDINVRRPYPGGSITRDFEPIGW